MEVEYKEFVLDSLKAEPEGLIVGHGAVFGNKDLQGDIIEPGAFKASLKRRGGKVKMFFQHMDPIGLFTAEEDDKGLLVEGHALIDEVRTAREAHALARAKVIDGLSIGYRVEKNGAQYDDDGTRRLSKLDVLEVSLVAFPANERARIRTAKADQHADAVEALDSIRDLEHFLREVGIPRLKAKAIASRGYAGLADLRDAGGNGAETAAALRALTATISTDGKEA